MIKQLNFNEQALIARQDNSMHCESKLNIEQNSISMRRGTLP